MPSDTNPAPGAAAAPLIEGIGLHGLLGSGGTARVYAGTQLANHARVAVKVLRAELSQSPEQWRAFRREARLLSRIDHPGVPRVAAEWRGDAAGPTPGAQPWIALELVPGETLAAHVRERGPLETSDALALAAALLDALGAVHRTGLVHRDVTPANVMFELPPGEPIAAASVRLLDFGIAARSGEHALGRDLMRPRAAASGGGGSGARGATLPAPHESLGVLGNPLYV